MDEYDKHMHATQAILDNKFKSGKIQNMYIGEVLEGFSEIPGFKDRVIALQNNSDRSLNTILQVTYKNDRPRLSGNDIESIKYIPASAEEDVSIAPMNLYDTAKRLYVFYREDMTVDQMKKVAFEILSNLHPSEAEIFKGIFAGKLPVANITKNLVESAFPGLFAGEKKVEEPKPAKTKTPAKPGKKVIGKPMKKMSEIEGADNIVEKEATTEDIEEAE